MKRVIEAIKKHNKFLITAHINLEGDSLGSQLAAKALLEKLGKSAIVVDSDPIPEHYKFLPGAGEVSNAISEDLDFDAAIVIDCPTLERTGRVKGLLANKKFIINIDHHISNVNFGDVNWVDPNASSAGEMIYRLFKETGAAMTKEVALSLYIAILTDTGSFNYENTSSITHEIVGELLGYGLEPAAISENVYERRTVSDIKLLGLALSTLKINKRGDVAYMEISNKMLAETNTDASKTEGFINYARSIDGVKIAILFREDQKSKERISVSFRSKADVDVNTVAAYFGGGGHVRASGCVIKGSLAEAEKKVLAKVEEMLGGRHTDSR